MKFKAEIELEIADDELRLYDIEMTKLFETAVFNRFDGTAIHIKKITLTHWRSA